MIKQELRNKVYRESLLNKEGRADSELYFLFKSNNPPKWFSDDLTSYLFLSSLNRHELTSCLLQYAYRMNSKHLWDLLLLNINHQSWVVRCDVAELLSCFPGKKEAFNLLGKVLLLDENVHVKKYAAVSIGEFKKYKTKAVGFLTDFFHREKSVLLRASAAGGFLMLGEDAYGKCFWGSFNSKSNVVRTNSYHIAKNLDNVYSKEKLIFIFKSQINKEPVAEYRLLIRRIIKEIESS